jgi:hypothetical protein
MTVSGAITQDRSQTQTSTSLNLPASEESNRANSASLGGTPLSDFLAQPTTLERTLNGISTCKEKQTQSDAKDFNAAANKLYSDPNFKRLDEAEQQAIRAQINNHKDIRVVENFQKLVQKAWFRIMKLEDTQRTLKIIGDLTTHNGDRNIVENTLSYILNPNSRAMIVWDDLGESTSGVSRKKTHSDIILLDRAKISADNQKLDGSSEKATHISRHTLPHEACHNINKDYKTRHGTYGQFFLEYRAWYVGFKAEHNRVPTVDEAAERISVLFSSDGYKGIQEAAKKPEEAPKFYQFLSKLSGVEVNKSNINSIIDSRETVDLPKDGIFRMDLPSTWHWKTDKNAPAPEPTGILNNKPQ